MATEHTLRLGIDATGARQGSGVYVRSLEDIRKKAAETTSGIEMLQKAGAALTVVGARLTAFVTLPLTGAAAAFVKLASDAQETRAKFEAVFKGLTSATRAWARDFSTAIGRNQVEVEGFLARLQDTFVPLGFARDRAADLSKQLVTLATDLAAFDNIAESDALDALTSALVGNHEAVRRFGIVITETSLKAELLRMGIVKGAAAATEQEKAQARLNIILQSSADASGQAMREADGAANSFRSLASASKDAAIALGERLLPVVVPMVKNLAEMLRGVSNLNPEIVKWGLALGGAAAILGPLATGLGLVATGLWAVAAASSAVAAAWTGGLSLVVTGLTAFWIKTKLDAGEAAEAVRGFRDALRGMNEQQLIASTASLIAEQSRVGRELFPKETALERGRRKIKAGMGWGIDVVRRLEDEVAPLRARYDALGEQIREMVAQFNFGISGTSIYSHGAPVPSQATGLSIEQTEAAKAAAKAATEAAAEAMKKAGEKFDRLWTRVERLGEGMFRNSHAMNMALRTGQFAGVAGGGAQYDHTTGRVVNSDLAARTRAGMVLDYQGGIGDARVRSGPAPDAGMSLFGRARGAASDAAGNALSGLASGAMSLLNAFNPLSLLATIFAESLQAVTPALEGLRPVVEMIAKILGAALAPVIEGMFPIFKMLAIAATYVGQVFFNIAGGIATAIGWLIQVLGKVVDTLNGWFGGDGGLGKIGRSISSMGKGFLEAAGALGTARDEIKKIEFDDAAKAVRDFTDALTDVPRVVNLALYRARVTGTGPTGSTGGSAGGTGGGSAGGGITTPGARDPVPATFTIENMTIVNEAGDDEVALARKVARGTQMAFSQGIPIHMPGVVVAR